MHRTISGVIVELEQVFAQQPIFGILDSASNDSIFKSKIFINHIIPIFKLYVYNSREKKFININNLTADIQKVKKLEKEIALINSKKAIAFTKKEMARNK